MRAIINIVIIILLSLSLYIIPLSTNTFDFSMADDENNKKSESVKYDCVFNKVTEGKFLYNPKKYELSVDFTKNIPENMEENILCELEFFDYNQEKIVYKNSDLGEFISDKKSEHFTVSIDFDALKKKLMYSTYDVHLKISCLNNDYEDDFKVFFEKENIQLQANNEPVPAYLHPYYYSDKSLNYSIPIYRQNIQVANSFANVMYSMNNKPEEIEKIGLKPFLINMDYRPNMWFHNGSLSCGFSENNIKDIKTKAEAESLITNLLNSYEELSGAYIINEVEFYIKGSEKKDIHGFSIVDSFKIDRMPKVYLPIFVNDMDGKTGTYYWLPTKIETDGNIESQVLSMLEIYKNSPEYMSSPKFISLIPNVEVYKNISLVDDNLIIEITDEMYEFLEKNKDYAEMIKEGFALSFSSLYTLKSYEIWHDDELIQEVNGVEFGERIKAPLSFNRLN